VNKSQDNEELALRLNAETARISWQELERHFARGALITVASELDLVNVGVHMIKDDKTIIDAWLDNGEIRATTDDEAKAWSEDNRELWAVVVAPWVLVQEDTKVEDDQN
jgi:hypothetical protein